MDFLEKKFSYVLNIVIFAAIVLVGGYLFFRFLLPLLIIVGVVAFVVIKVRNLLKINSANRERAYDINVDNNSGFERVDNLDGEIIDVDYKEVH